MQKENISTTIYVQYRFAVMQFGTCCLNLTINLSNPKKVNPQASKNYYVRLWDRTSQVQFFSKIDTGLWLSASYWLRRVTEIQATWVLSASPQPFCVSLNKSVHYHSSFYTQYFFSRILSARNLQSPADRILTPNMNIRLQLFGSTFCRALGPDLPTCSGSRIGTSTVIIVNVKC